MTGKLDLKHAEIYDNLNDFAITKILYSCEFVHIASCLAGGIWLSLEWQLKNGFPRTGLLKKCMLRQLCSFPSRAGARRPR
jgi:hypothetical protein